MVGNKQYPCHSILCRAPISFHLPFWSHVNRRNKIQIWVNHRPTDRSNREEDHRRSQLKTVDNCGNESCRRWSAGEGVIRDDGPSIEDRLPVVACQLEEKSQVNRQRREWLG